MIQCNDITIEPTATPFSTLALTLTVLTNLAQLGYTNMTPIQTASLPIALADHDLVAQAKTGSGKTAALALALLTRLDARSFDMQAVVLCPTRELANQAAQEIRRLVRAEEDVKVLTLCGGTPMRPWAASLEHGAHVIIGASGRIMDHLERGNLKLGAPKMLVLNEADRVLDMGFFDNIAAVVRQCPADRQTPLFSATYPKGVAELSQRILRNPKEVKLKERRDDSKVRRRFYEMTDSQRLHTMGQLLRYYRPVSTLAFCNTKQRYRGLPDALHAQGIHALALHDELERRGRDQVLIRFVNRSCSVPVMTDAAARGLDIAQFEAMVNADVMPDPEIYVRRVGRTGRADESGWTLSLASMDEMGRVDNIERVLDHEVRWHRPDEPDTDNDAPLLPPMETLQVLGGRREKIRPDDILGALTGDAGFHGDQIGEVDMTEFSIYIAVECGIAREALRKLSAGTVKGKKVRTRLVDE